MAELICISESVYNGALTRGRRYAVISVNDRQVRIKGDNGRIRWFPLYCFQGTEHTVPILSSFCLDDDITLSTDLPIEVTVQLSNGERRWCIFATPSALVNCGDWIAGTKVPFHYGNKHIILAKELSEDLIERILRYIDSQGELVECTLPLEMDEGDD